MSFAVPTGLHSDRENVLGVGKKVFDGGAVPTNVTLLEPPVASTKGTVYLRYGLADGTPGTGDMSAPDRGVGRGD
ncbi:hypothetical protein AB0K60_09225 [Thermopolyspora sp. NPDC052614]|uniref:hypothetical protein n=1 Tax=Thermopolyspora sp. NPDC052614 TaxID=3155682 RepID=UPI00341BB325